MRKRFYENASKVICASLGFINAFAIQNIANAQSWELKSSLTYEDRDTVIERLANDTTVSMNTGNVEVGKKFEIIWSRGRFPEREPVFLIISFDKPVRFTGESLYGLLPEARAAFDISWENQLARAVIPYYGRGVPKSGRVSVEPILSGTVSINWAVVGYNGCSQRIDTPNQGTNTVVVKTSGRPRIVIYDPDDLGTPTAKFVNKSGNRILEVFEGQFRLVDVASGAEILETIGSDPYFSPAGRYLVVSEGDRAGTYDVIDGSATIGNPITEKTIRQPSSYSIGLLCASLIPLQPLYAEQQHLYASLALTQNSN